MSNESMQIYIILGRYITVVSYSKGTEFRSGSFNAMIHQINL